MCARILIFVACLAAVAPGEEFHHERRLVREELGDEVYVRATGRTRGIVDLDDNSVVKVYVESL